jgi:hypothetical protein
MPANMENKPPLLSTSPGSGRSSLRQLLVVVLSLCLGLFLVDAFVSLTDDSLNLFFKLHPLSVIRQVVAFFALLMVLLVYGLMAITPMIPKRLFLPLAVYHFLILLFGVPLTLYEYDRLLWMVWCCSACQVVLGLMILYCVQGKLKLRWPLVPAARLGTRWFSWANLCIFVLANVFVLLPVALIFLTLVTATAVNHFSNGFMSVRPGGLTVQMRKYVRNDGKTIELFPMAHVADADFYQEISLAFPTNSIILMEGVTDEHHLLTNDISYKRIANTLGLAEQHEAFAPDRGKKVPADVDISIFTTNTLDLLNLVMLFHARGLNPDILQKLALYPQPPQLVEEVMDDVLRKRNQHLLEQLNEQLSQADYIIIPWGVAHMPGLSKEIQKAGFHLTETHDYTIIHFHGGGKPARTPKR